MKIYVICPVRGARQEQLTEIKNRVVQLRKEGHIVHYPPEDAPQDDPTGWEICSVHL